MIMSQSLWITPILKLKTKKGMKQKEGRAAQENLMNLAQD